MKLTKAEYELLDGLIRIRGTWPLDWMKPATRACAKRMRSKGLLSKRWFDQGYAAITAAGKRSHSYGPR
jgi:hypothetical protein